MGLAKPFKARGAGERGAALWVCGVVWWLQEGAEGRRGLALHSRYVMCEGKGMCGAGRVRADTPGHGVHMCHMRHMHKLNDTFL